MRLNYTGDLFCYTANKYSSTPQLDKWVVYDPNQSNLQLPCEYWGKLINSTHLPSFQVNDYAIENIKDDLQFLNARLDYLRKTITYWDSYQILGTIDNKSQINKIEALDVGKSLIINSSNSFQWNNQTCSRGGVFVNTFDQGIVYIPPMSAGIYQPTFEEDTNSSGIKIKYTFHGSTPQHEITGVADFIDSEEHYYNETGSLNSDHQNITFNSDMSIIPVIAFEYQGEDIYLDYQLTSQLTDENKLQYTFQLKNSLPKDMSINYKVK